MRSNKLFGEIYSAFILVKFHINNNRYQKGYKMLTKRLKYGITIRAVYFKEFSDE